MMDFYKLGSLDVPVIDTDASPTTVSHPACAVFGAIPRDYTIDPETMRAAPSDMVLVPESEWDARYDEQEVTQSSLEHIYLSGPNGDPAFVNLDQNGHGDCWAFSTAHAIMIDRLKRNLSPVRLNPHATAVILNQLDGGWCGLSATFNKGNGVAEDGTGPGQWPGHTRNRQYDTPALRASMAKYKLTEDWYDMARDVWDQRLNRSQLATCGFSNIPAPSDFNWWGHSVCQLRWVRVERGSWGPLILNSWANWGKHGLAVLRGSQATANGAVGVRSTSAS